MKKRTLNRSDFAVFAIELGCIGLLPLLMLFPANCIAVNGNMENQTKKGHLTTNDYVRDIVNHPAFKGFGELMLPWDDNASYYDMTIGSS